MKKTLFTLLFLAGCATGGWDRGSWTAAFHAQWPLEDGLPISERPVVYDDSVSYVGYSGGFSVNPHWVRIQRVAVENRSNHVMWIDLDCNGYTLYLDTYIPPRTGQEFQVQRDDLRCVARVH